MLVASIMFKPKCGCSWYLLGNPLSRCIVAPIVEYVQQESMKMKRTQLRYIRDKMTHFSIKLTKK